MTFTSSSCSSRMLKNGVGWPGRSPCSRNARPQKSRRGSSQTILCARRTRTIKRCSSDARSEGQSGCSPEGEVRKTRRPSPGQMARLGVSVGGRVRTLRAVGIVPATPLLSDSLLRPCWTAFLSILQGVLPLSRSCGPVKFWRTPIVFPQPAR
jgi:hypothetical protein